MIRRPIDLSVIIVNYRSASYTLHAVASVLRQEVESEHGGRCASEVLVIDNGSPPEDAAMLEALPPSARLVRNATNLGFATAVNQGIRDARGKFLCLLNPDTHLFPRALQQLLEQLYRHPDVAAAGPRAWWDEEKTFLLPLVRLPTPRSMILESLARLNYRLGQAVCAPWHRRDLALWRGTVPVPIDILNGACLVTRRAVLERVGGFDPGYFLYYEDADWCSRVRRHGYRLLYVPTAEIVHYYNQSAQLAPEQSKEWMLRSRNYYLRKQFGPWSPVLCEWITALAGEPAKQWQPALPRRLHIDLGPLEEPPLFSGRQPVVQGEVVFELSHHSSFALKSAAFKCTPELYFPLPLWKRLQPGRYYTRLIDLTTCREEKIWSWQKL